MRSTLVAIAATSTLLLSGCAAGMISQTAQQVPAVDGGSGTVGAMSAHDVLLATPPAANYPKGSDVKLLAVLSNDSTADDTLTGVTSPVGDVKLSGKIVIPAGGSVTLSTDSSATATVTAIKKVLCYGQGFPITFAFAQAGQVTMNVSIKIPAERTGTRNTIDIQPPHPTAVWEEGEHASAAPGSAPAAASGGASAAPAADCTS